MLPNYRYLPLAAGLLLVSTLAAAEPMIKLQVSGQWKEGQPLLWSDREVTLLLRDGQVLEFPPSAAANYSAVATGFRSYSAAEMRAGLVHEFGQGFEVGGSGHYIVVYPTGQREQWATRFEDLYRSFVHYFKSRGWTPQEPQFPLVAVVFPQEVDFHAHTARQGVAVPPGTLGYYTPQTNRILLFDTTAGTRGSDWSLNAETVIHEATHQIAFNTGLHRRFGQSPRWVAEGLGTMFEAPGVWNSLRHPQLAERVNRGRLASFRRYLQTRRSKNAIADIVSSDRIFQTDMDGAYGEAWALTFFLSESEPRKYLQYLLKTSAVQPFQPYLAPQRLKDFTDVFGTNLPLLDARYQRFIREL